MESLRTFIPSMALANYRKDLLGISCYLRHAIEWQHCTHFASQYVCQTAFNFYNFWHADNFSYVLYRMVKLPMTLGDP